MAYVSPTKPIAVVAWRESALVGSGEVEVSQWLATVGVNGRLVNRKRIDSLTYMERDRRWSSDGKTFVSTAFVANMEERTTEDGFLHYDPGTGAIEFKTEAEPTWEPRLTDGLALATEPNLIERGGHTYQFDTTWVRSGNRRNEPGGFVTEHSENAKLAPNAGHVAYMAEGALFVKRLKKLSSREYEQYLYDVVKSRAMSQAKQVQLALLMYSADYDGLIPENLSPHSDLGPYVKNAALIDSFTYLFPGGLLTELEDPARTVLGYIDTPYGRATAYADGHVEWEEKS
ncbi:MAG: hypothetical protein IIC73_01835 [Armatimonadetes bacterium]|nr:hypothetical protein [Armatimonadota bacterium]